MRYLLKVASCSVIFAVLVAATSILWAQEARAAPADCYWVNGTGDWSDAANHWAIVSGGAAGAGNLPDATSNVHFDANSFGGPYEIVTVDSDAFCKTMDWTGATNKPVLQPSNSHYLECDGDVTFIEAMLINSGSMGIHFKNANANLTTNGAIINCHILITGAITLDLQDDLTGFSMTLNNNAILETNNHDVILRYRFLITQVAPHTVRLGSSNFFTPLWQINSGTLNVAPNTATITITASSTFDGGGDPDYYNVVLSGREHTITGSNTFNTLTLDPGLTQTVSFTDGTTQTVTNASLGAAPGHLHTLQGTGAAGWAITKAGGGTVNSDYIDISYCTGNPADTWMAGAYSVDGGGNTGWAFAASAASPLATYNSNRWVAELEKQIDGTTYDCHGLLMRTGPDTITYFFRQGLADEDKGKIVKQDYTISTNSWNTRSDVYTDADLDCRNIAGGVIGNNIYLFFYKYRYTMPPYAGTAYNQRGYIKSTDLTGSAWGAFTEVALDGSMGCYGALVETGMPNTYLQTCYTRIAKTTDNGTTWTEGTPIVAYPYAWRWTETSAAYIGGGRIIALLRHDSGEYVGQATSSDNGNTWSSVKETNLGNSVGVKIPWIYYDSATGKVIALYVDRVDGLPNAPNSTVKIAMGDANEVFNDATAWNEPSSIMGPVASNPPTPGYPSLIGIGENSYLAVWGADNVAGGGQVDTYGGFWYMLPKEVYTMVGISAYIATVMWFVIGAFKNVGIKEMAIGGTIIFLFTGIFSILLFNF